MKHRSLLLFAGFIVWGCIDSPPPALSPRGEIASVYLKDGGSVKGELLTLTEDSLFCLSGSLKMIPLSSISRVEVDYTAPREWVVPVILVQGIPSIILTVVSSSTTVFGVLGLVLTGSTTALFLSGEPKTDFQQPWTSKDRASISHYFRHPYRMSDEEINRLKGMYLTAH